ncbi:hypothetical protein PspCFBP13508_15085 [Pseudomonas sp. CFBP13508]|nr:hypothetical protein PspCFBP13508_15085 [Pseudomonas sp. CFBP13508]
MGASLLANAMYQSPCLLADPPLSRAGSLPQGLGVVLVFVVVSECSAIRRMDTANLAKGTCRIGIMVYHQTHRHSQSPNGAAHEFRNSQDRQLCRRNLH